MNNKEKDEIIKRYEAALKSIMLTEEKKNPALKNSKRRSEYCTFYIAYLAFHNGKRERKNSKKTIEYKIAKEECIKKIENILEILEEGENV